MNSCNGNTTTSDTDLAPKGVKPYPSLEVICKALPGEENTTKAHVYQASKDLVDAGLSLLPIEAYTGTKSPDIYRLPHPFNQETGGKRPSWAILQMRRPNPDELKRWYDYQGDYGLAVICGTVSGNNCRVGLEVIDFDTDDLVSEWEKLVAKSDPELISRLVRVVTPRPGLHVYYRCVEYGVSLKLAMGQAKDRFGYESRNSKGLPIPKTLIEVKGEGGYCLIPPSPRRCHPTCKLYRYAPDSLPLTQVPGITPHQRNILLSAARSLNQWEQPKAKSPGGRIQRKNGLLDRPGDFYNAQAKWEDILRPHGWSFKGGNGNTGRWCRPDKSDGISATTNYKGSDLLHVFSSNADPFQAGESYSKFSAYAFLNHGGDFKKAAEALKAEGYGGHPNKGR